MLNEGQQIAYDDICKFMKSKRKVHVLEGYGGSGKSFLIAKLVEDLGVSTQTLTFTGKASSILRDKGVDSNTLHSALYQAQVDKFGNLKGFIATDKDLTADLIIVDEYSMVGEDIFKQLMKVADKVLLVGDPGQLPPVQRKGIKIPKGAKKNMLEEVMRQALDNPILKWATHKRLEKDSEMDFSNEQLTITSSDNYDFANIHKFDIVLCGKNSTRHNMNKVIRQQRGYFEKIPMVGEQIMIGQNREHLGLFNGMIVEIVNIEGEMKYGDNEMIKMLIRKSDGKELEITTYKAPYELSKFGSDAPRPNFKGMEQWQRDILFNDAIPTEFAYCITVHKSQGSEYKNVCMLAYDCFMKGGQKYKWLYTGITRASENLTYVYGMNRRI